MIDDVAHENINNTLVTGVCAQKKVDSLENVINEVKGDYVAIKDSSEKIADLDNTAGGQVKTENKLTTMRTLVNFEGCQILSLSTNDYQGVEGIFTRLEHLKKDIVKIEFGNYQSSRENDFFCHDLSVKVLVDTSRL